jgi:hypothetical protein
MVAQLRYRGLAYAFRPIVATGGTISTINVGGIQYRVHTFSNTGSFTFNVTDPGSEAELEYLVVAGGGGGGAADNEQEAGAGGGAGGLREGVFQLLGTGALPVSVGAAGAGGTGGNRVDPRPGRKGANSSFSSIVAAGGGGGLPPRGGDENRICDGGSGGGATSRSGPAGIEGVGNLPPTVPPQGNNGARGSGGSYGGQSTVAGGGGGANGPGSSNSTGGPGRPLSITGSLITYSKGGNGGVQRSYGAQHSPLERGSGGAGAGAAGEAPRTPSQFHPPGVAGIPGIVIVRYPLAVVPNL